MEMGIIGEDRWDYACTICITNGIKRTMKKSEVISIKGKAMTVECGICGAIWVEWGENEREACHGCGRWVWFRNVILNDERHPKVVGLDSKGVLVIYKEEAV